MNVDDLRSLLKEPKYQPVIARVRELEAASASPDTIAAAIQVEFPDLFGDTGTAVIVVAGTRVNHNTP